MLKSKIWKQAHLKQIKRYNRKYQKKHKRNRKKYMERYQKYNSERLKEYHRKYYWVHRRKYKRYYRIHKDRIIAKRIDYRKNKYKELQLYAKEYYQNNKQKFSNFAKKDYIKNKKKWQCREKTRRKYNIFGMKCELCNLKKRLIRHHPDYNNSNLFLCVCRKCHGYVHRKYKRDLEMNQKIEDLIVLKIQQLNK